MQKRCALLGMLLSALILLPGCPVPASPLVGTWIVTLDGNPDIKSGLQFNADGQALPFVVDGGIFAGDFTWEHSENRVVLDQVAGGTQRIIWAAVLTSSTIMTGANVLYAGGAVGDSPHTWTAVKQ